MERRDLSNERNTFKSKTIDILSQENKAKARVRYKADPEKKKALYATATRPIPKRRRLLYAKVTRPIPKRKKASVRDGYKADPEKKKASLYATAPLYATATRPIPKRRRPLCTRQHAYKGSAQNHSLHM